MNIPRPNLLLSLTLTVPLSAQGTDLAGICAVSVRDQAAPGLCISAASIPTPGMLLPLGPYFWVGASGDVGIGTQVPAARLDVAGDVRLDGRLAVGNDAVFGGPTDWDYAADLSYYVDSFSPYYSVGLHSNIEYDPPHDLTGLETTWLWSHVFDTRISDGNDRDVQALFGATSLALPRGTGTVTYVLGGGAVAENDAGHVIEQGGGSFISIGDHDATIDRNYWLTVGGGHWGTNGSVQQDVGIFVEEPCHDSPLVNHYGIFLEDQDFGVQDSYAIYSEGGASYFAGDIGIGNPAPAAALDVAGDFVASGTKSFRQAHPYDDSQEIWFVCLEGNEAGTYFRGTIALVNGRAEVPVPEEFALVSAAEGLTVQATALGDARVWVEQKSLDRIVLRGSADVEVDYFVNGIRAGYTQFQALRAKPESHAESLRTPRTPLSERTSGRLESRLADPR